MLDGSLDCDFFDGDLVVPSEMASKVNNVEDANDLELQFQLLERGTE